MKQRLGVFVGLVAAFLVAAFGVAGPASASADAGVSATSVQALQKKVKNLQKKVKKATKKSKATCKKAKGKKGKKGKKAKKRCKASKKQAKKLRGKLKSAQKSLKRERAKSAAYFDVCKHGCAYRTVQAGVDAAGNWQAKTKKRATVRVQPGEYVEGVYLYGSKYDNLTIMGVDKNKKPLQGIDGAKQVKLQGKNAKTDISQSPGWQPTDVRYVPANNAIEGRNVQGLVMKNMWAENYLNNTFFVWASTNPSFNERCSDYVMDNLVTSDTRSYGFFARNCFGGTISNSEGWNHGDSAVYIGETPCDDPNWNNRDASPKACQANPNWTVIDNVKSHQNVLGYSGTNSKYVEIKNSAFFNNGAGIVPNTLDSEKFEPAGWMKIHDNDIFWNNYNYFSTGSEFQTVSDGLGELLGATVNYPMGVGVVLFGTDSVEVKNNRIFGNEKWGAMTFSAPVITAFDVEANKDDDAKNLNNQFIDNEMGRNGQDPNRIDFLNDFTGGGNCWSGNTASGGVTWALNQPVMDANGVTQAEIYPACPQPKKLNKGSSSFNLSAGIQVVLDEETNPVLDPETILGYVAADPAKNQECSWDVKSHPAYTDASGYGYTEKRADPVVCE